jgi:hypothetical protein
MKVHQINPINFREAEPERFAQTSWPLVSQLGLDLLFGIAASSYEAVVLLIALHLSGAAIGWWRYSIALHDPLTISSEDPGENELKKAA